jgi:hypothetical protein
MGKLKKVNKVLLSSLLVSTVSSQALPTNLFAQEHHVDPTLSSSSGTLAANWARESLLTLKNRGFMTGSNGDLRPLDEMTRQEMAALITKSLEFTLDESLSSSFKDVAANNWATKYIEPLKQIGIMQGNGVSFNPKDNLTREELAIILVRVTGVDVKGKGENLEFADKDQISAWAKDYVQAAFELGLLKGNGTHFNPKKKATRQEVAVASKNLISNPKYDGYKKTLTTKYNNSKTSNSDPVLS